MGQNDIYESDYLDNPEIFADLVNGVLYHGEQVINPQELQEQDGELRVVGGGHVRKTIRDKVKLWKGIILAIIAVENQTTVDYHMVIRNMLTESMAYDKQWKSGKAKNKKGKYRTSDEFLSGMKKEDKFIPVVTIVVYYGKEKAWDGARTLHELLDVKGEGKRILPFISNYRLNLFDYHEYDDFKQFHSELQPVFEFLRYAGDKGQLREKLEKHKGSYRNLSSQAKVLLTKLTNIKKIPGVEAEQFEKGEFDMCKAFEDMKEEGREEGREEGMMTAIRNLMKSKGWTAQDAMDALMLPLSKQELYFNMGLK